MQTIYSYQFKVPYLWFGEVVSSLIYVGSCEGVGSIPILDIFS